MIDKLYLSKKKVSTLKCPRYDFKNKMTQQNIKSSMCVCERK